MYLLTTTVVLCGFLLKQGNACMSGDPNNPLGPQSSSTNAPTTALATDSTTPLTTAAATTAGNPYVAACKAVGADFGNGDNGGYTAKSFSQQDKRLNNKGTGVPDKPSGKSKYMGASLKPGEKATLTSLPVSVTDNKNLLVNYYEATDGIVLKGCSNDESNCQPISNKGISKDDLKWKQGNYPLTSATNKVILVAENTGSNTGAVGIDKVGISDAPDGPDHCNGQNTASA